MAKIKALLRELNKALKTNDYTKFLDLIRSDTKCLRHKFGPENRTLLHHLCAVNVRKINFGGGSLENIESDEEDEKVEKKDEFEIDEDAFIEMLDTFISEFDCDLNVRDKQGNTPLHYATSTDNERVASLLLDFEETIPDLPNSRGNTPLEIAAHNQFSAIEKLLLQASNQQVHNQEIPEGMDIKKFQRANKEAIVDLGPLKPLKSEKPSAYEAIESTLFIQNEAMRKQFEGVFKVAYESEILRPMLNLMGLCALKGTITQSRRITLFMEYQQLQELKKEASEDDLDLYAFALKQKEKELGKRFKIICVDAPDVGSLKPLAAEPRGLYTHKNSVFAATEGLDLYGVLAVILHESSHFGIDHLFKNSSAPYPKGFDIHQRKERFQKIVQTTKENLTQILSSVSSEEELAAYNAIQTVFTAYPKEEWDIELIVRVPQIIALLGPEKGPQWLQKNTPELLEYYLTVINPAIMGYLAEYDASKYLSDPHSLLAAKVL
ncbi:ankyrin repeat domain-containing protein [Legionella sp.]|uniref:ankyrin repeat domain-containing protein n=1 Tax=Legionella sp. TaxID=459 RepID=UPI00321F9959